MKDLTHGYVNTQIMNYLELVGYSNFHSDLKDGYVCYETKYVTPEGNHEIITQFEIRESTIVKDSEYHGTNVRTGEKEQLSITRYSTPNSLLLQDLFDEWYVGYLKWMEE